MPTLGNNRPPKGGGRYLANGLINGNILLSTSSLSEQSTQLTSAPARNAGEGGLALDPLQAQISALRQQALVTQNSIQQLQAQDTGSTLWDTPWGMGAQGLVFGLGAILLGWLLVRLVLGRAPAVVVPVAPKAQDFVESRYYLTDRAPLPDPVVVATAQAGPVAGVAPVPPVFAEADFVQSAPMADSESVFNMFWESDAPSTTPITEPLVDEARAELMAFAPQMASPEFDPQAAANEVERVRRSLAEKREARTRQRLLGDILHYGYEPEEVEVSLPPADVPPVFPVRVAGEQVPDLDLDLDWSGESQDPPQVALQEPPLPEEPAVAPVLETPGHEAVDVYLDPPEPEPETMVPDSAVQLALAQEFVALGLLEGARELAQEVLVSGQEPLQRDAQTLLNELDAQEAALRVGQLVVPLEPSQDATDDPWNATPSDSA